MIEIELIRSSIGKGMDRSMHPAQVAQQKLPKLPSKASELPRRAMERLKSRQLWPFPHETLARFRLSAAG